MSLGFSDWLKMQENATTTGDVAVFARQCLPMIRRANLGAWGVEDPFFKKLRKKRLNEGEPALKLAPLPPLRLVDPSQPHSRLDKAQRGILYCPQCQKPTRLKHMYYPRFDDDGNIVDGLCPRCMMQRFLSS